MRRALLFCAAIAFAIACGDSITEPLPDGKPAPTPVSFATTTTEDGLSISTDKDDYAPGDTVHFTGIGWQPGDSLDIVLVDDAVTQETHTWTVGVGDDGTFHDSTYVVDTEDLNVTFTLTATSRLTGRSLTVTFTDGNLQLQPNPTPDPFSPNADGIKDASTISWRITGTGNENGVTIRIRQGTTIGGTQVRQFNLGNQSPGASGTVVWDGKNEAVPAVVVAEGEYTMRIFSAAQTEASASGQRLYIALVDNTAPVISSPAVSPTPVAQGSNTDVSVTGTATDNPAAGVSPNRYKPVSGEYNIDGGAFSSMTVSGGSGPNVKNLSATIPGTTVQALSAGSHLVCIRATDDAGNTSPNNATGNSNCASLAVTASNAAPTVDAGGPYTGAEGSPIALSPTASDPDGDALTYKWTVNTTGIDAGGACTFDDDTKKDAKVTCTDDSNLGTFTLTLTVDDGKGHTTADNADLTVTNANPTADAAGPYTGNEGSAIQLNGSGDDPGNNDDAGLTYKWTINTAGIDLGGTCAFDDDTKKDAKVTCTDDSNGGHFTLSLVVSDDDGGVSQASSANLTVTNLKPVADAGGPYSGDEGSAIQLGGSGDDPGNNDDAGLTYKWTVNTTGIDAGGVCTFDDDTKKNAKVTCTDDSGNATGGHFTLSLVVKDDDGGTSDASSANLTVANAAPVAEAGGPYSGNEGSAIQLNGTTTDVGSNDTHTWSWVYIAGPGVDAGATCSFDDANAEDPKITCTDDGTVKLTFTATDDNGGEGSDEATLTLANLPPVANAGGPYSGAEGSAISLNGSANDPGDNDDPHLTYQWTVNTAGIDAGGTCTFDDATKKDAKITCTDDSNLGTFTLSLVATDDDGGVSVASTASLTVTNANPIATAGGPYSGNEGAAIQLNGSGDDPGNNDDPYLTYLWTVNTTGIDVGGTCTFDDATKKNAKVTCTDDGTFTLTLTVTDDDLGTGTSTATLTVANVAPILGAITAPLAPVNISSAVNVSAPFTDQGTNDTHTGSIDWGDGTSAAVITEANGSGSASGSHYYSETGVYTIKMTVTDDDGAVSNQSIFQYVVVYDPSAGFVSGGGWINSPAGACYIATCNATTTGKANFGFVSKYLKATSTVPSGNTEFQFQAGNLNFHSEVYEWLLVNQAGTNAQYKGSGTINGVGGYKFMLWATDGSYDTFRIKIWQEIGGSEVVAYDNMGTGGGGYSTVPIAGGSIVIHVNGKVASK